MLATVSWGDDDDPAPDRPPSQSRADGSLPPAVEAAVWRGTDLTRAATPTVSTGFASLDAELPGGGWPRRSLTELLQPQSSLLEWRLLAPSLRPLVASQQTVVLVGAPKIPHLPGLQHEGLDQQLLVRVDAHTPAERLWCTEQLIKSNSAGAILAWLPQCRPEHLRRLQVAALNCEAPVFVFRSPQAQHEPSPAPLRLLASVGLDWELRVQILKRRGPTIDELLHLHSIPGSLASVLAPRLLRPSLLLQTRETVEHAPAVVGPATRQRVAS